MGFHVPSTIWPAPTCMAGPGEVYCFPLATAQGFASQNDSSLSTHGSIAFLTVVAG